MNSDSACSVSSLAMAELMAAVALSMVTVAGCRSTRSGDSGAANSESVTVVLNDPDPCVDRFEHFWVTVSDVRASTRSSTSPAGPGFVDFTPGLKAAPKQIDLLGPVTACFPSEVGTASGAAPGNYIEVRVSFLPNGSSVEHVAPIANECRAAGADVFNCVVDSSGGYHRLNLPPDVREGIELSPSHLLCGRLSIAAREAVDVGLFLNSCASVGTPNPDGSFDLKPVLWAWTKASAPPGQ